MLFVNRGRHNFLLEYQIHFKQSRKRHDVYQRVYKGIEIVVQQAKDTLANLYGVDDRMLSLVDMLDIQFAFAPDKYASKDAKLVLMYMPLYYGATDACTDNDVDNIWRASSALNIDYQMSQYSWQYDSFWLSNKGNGMYSTQWLCKSSDKEAWKRDVSNMFARMFMCNLILEKLGTFNTSFSSYTSAYVGFPLAFFNGEDKPEHKAQGFPFVISTMKQATNIYVTQDFFIQTK